MIWYFKTAIYILETVKSILEWHCKKCNKAKLVERYRESEGK